MAGVHFELAPASLFTAQPDALPATLTPPNRSFSIAHPFNISDTVYNSVLSINVPLTIATVYATTVWYLNRVNKRRQHKPWRVSKSRAFFALVVLHNVALAVYSGWTTVGMARVLKNTLPAWSPQLSAPEVVDALCKVSGPRGFGSAVAYSAPTSTWASASRFVRLLGDSPDPTDVGRLWNEGLGYYGWLFYLSKFYEVVDTLIILAKGKKSSFLQTYHHAGAMLCMWAGIRYMSPPIWLFVQINSFIHTIMVRKRHV